jgi:hypothetical protein
MSAIQQFCRASVYRQQFFHPRSSAVISIGECNTSDLIMGEEVVKWQREVGRVCLISRKLNCGRDGRRVNA